MSISFAPEVIGLLTSGDVGNPRNPAVAAQLGPVAGNGHRVLESLFDRPIISVDNVVALTGTTFAAANTLVARLVDAGVVTEVTGYARNRRFRFDSYIALFNEAPLVAPM